MIALSAFVLPENIGDNTACVGFVSLMEQFLKFAIAGIVLYAGFVELYLAAVWAASILILALSCFLYFMSSTPIKFRAILSGEISRVEIPKFCRFQAAEI